MSVSFSTLIQKARPYPNHTTTTALRSALSKIPTTTVTALPNGLRVASEENNRTEFATIALRVDAGSKYEARPQNGAAKLLELANFYGTANQSREQLSKAIEEVGGHLHVETGREHVTYLLKAHKNNLQKAVGLLADVVRNGKFDDAGIVAAKKEIEVIRQESEEDVDEVVMGNLHTAAYDSTDYGLGLATLGTKDSAAGLTRDDLKKFRDTHYTAPRMVLASAGGVNHTQLEKVARDFFGDVSKDNNKPKNQATRYVGGDMRLWNLRMKTAHIAWGFETCGVNCGDTLAIQLALQIFGPYHRSQHEMGQHNLTKVFKVYSSQDHGTPTVTHFPEKGIETVNPFYHAYEDSGLAGLYIVGRPAKTSASSADNLHSYLQYSMADFCRITQKAIHAQELEQAKVNLKAQLLYNMDGCSNSVTDIGRQILYHGRRVSLEEMYSRIDDVTPTNIMETLQHYFYARKPVMSCMGYIYLIPGYDQIVHWTYKYFY